MEAASDHANDMCDQLVGLDADYMQDCKRDMRQQAKGSRHLIKEVIPQFQAAHGRHQDIDSQAAEALHLSTKIHGEYNRKLDTVEQKLQAEGGKDRFYDIVMAQAQVKAYQKKLDAVKEGSIVELDPELRQAEQAAQRASEIKGADSARSQRRSIDRFSTAEHRSQRSSVSVKCKSGCRRSSMGDDGARRRSSVERRRSSGGESPVVQRFKAVGKRLSQKIRGESEGPKEERGRSGPRMGMGSDDSSE